MASKLERGSRDDAHETLSAATVDKCATCFGQGGTYTYQRTMLDSDRKETRGSDVLTGGSVLMRLMRTERGGAVYCDGGGQCLCHFFVLVVVNYGEGGRDGGPF